MSFLKNNNTNSGVKNILFFEANRDGTVGGSHACMFNIIRELDKRKYNVIAGFYQENIYIKKYREIDVATKVFSNPSSVNSNIFIRKTINWYKLCYQHGREIRQFLLDSNIKLVVLNNSVSIGLVFVKVCKALKIPIISYERGFGIYASAHIEATRYLDASIAVSKAILKNMVDQNFHSKFTKVIYDGLSNKNNNKVNNPEAVRKGLGIGKNDYVVGIVGNIRPWKGQEFFVKAFIELGEKYRNLYGLVIGGCSKDDNAYFEHLRKIGESRECGKRLLFLGYRDDVSDLFSIMDVFVHASIHPEPFGMVVLEAMYNKVPVIATNAGGPMEILENGKYGILVPPKSETAIANGIEKYLNDSGFREKKVQGAYKRVIESFLMDTTVRETEELFRDIGI